MNTLERIDSGIMDAHQGVADYANGLNEGISPYWLAAQIAGLNSILNIAIALLEFSRGENGWTALRVMIAVYALIMFQIVFRRRNVEQSAHPIVLPFSRRVWRRDHDCRRDVCRE